jgi:uncharacterized protein (TIGR00251 family)
MGTIADIVVVTKSPAFSVSAKDGIIKIRLTSPPEKGEANAELEKKLSKALGGISVRILSGHTSRRKRIEIDMPEPEWRAYLERQK